MAHSSGDWKSKSEAWEDLVSSGVHAVCITDGTFFLHCLLVKGTNMLPKASFMRALTPFIRLHPHDLITSHSFCCC